MLLAMVEVFVPSEALQRSWTDSRRKFWGMKLHLSLSAEDLIQILKQLENAIKRDYLSSNFETTSELLDFSNPSPCTVNDSSSPAMVSVLPWVPQTTATVASRLMNLDGSISYLPHQKVKSQKDKADRDFIKLPAKYAVVKKNTRDKEIAETPYRVNSLREANLVGMEIGFTGPIHGRGNRGKGRGRSTCSGRSQKRVAGSRSESGKRSASSNGERLGQLLVWKGKSHGGGGRTRGRHSVRSRQKSAKKVVGEKDTPKERIFEKSRNFVVGGWNVDEITRLHLEGAENASNSGRSEYENEDENDQATGDEYNDIMVDEYIVGFDVRSNDLQEGSEDNVDVDKEEDGDDEGDKLQKIIKLI